MDRMLLWVTITLVSIPHLFLFLAEGLTLLRLFVDVEVVKHEAFFEQLSRGFDILALVLVQHFGLRDWCGLLQHAQFLPMVRLITGFEPLVQSLEHLMAHRRALSRDNFTWVHPGPRCLKCLLLLLNTFECLRFVQFCLRHQHSLILYLSILIHLSSGPISSLLGTPLFGG